jgi:hypothetical protein
MKSKKTEMVQHVSKYSVSRFVDGICEIWSLGGASPSILYIGWMVAKV